MAAAAEQSAQRGSARDEAMRAGSSQEGFGQAGGAHTDSPRTRSAARPPAAGPTRRWLTGDRVLWVIVFVLATVSVLVVYSSTAKMAYDAHTMRSLSLIHI